MMKKWKMLYDGQDIVILKSNYNEDHAIKGTNREDASMQQRKIMQHKIKSIKKPSPKPAAPKQLLFQILCPETLVFKLKYSIF